MTDYEQNLLDAYKNKYLQLTKQFCEANKRIALLEKENDYLWKLIDIMKERMEPGE